MKLRIERGIPIPKVSSFKDVRRVLSQMQVGDSIKVSEQPNHGLLYQKLAPKKIHREERGAAFRIWRTR